MRAVAADGRRGPVQGGATELIRRATLVAGLAILLGVVASDGRADPDGVPAKAPAPPASGPAKAAEAKKEEKPERELAFSMDSKPWALVFAWLADKTDKPVIAPVKPTGSFSFISPTGRKYTIPEIIDIINEALLSNSATQKYYMIHRERSFVVVPADEKVDPALLPRITPDELSGRGRTELVSMTMQLKSLVADDFGPEAKKMLGPFGDVVVLSRPNQLVVQDTVGNLRRLIKTVDEIEKNDSAKGGSLTHQCKWIKAGEAARILKELLPSPRDIISMATSRADTGGAAPGGMPGGMPGGGFLGGAGGGGNRGGPGGGQPVIQMNKLRMHYIASDERTNKVLVTGPADKVAEAEGILKRIDVENPGQKPVAVGPATLKIYTVAAGTSEAVAKTLSEAYRASPTCRISAAGSTKVLVYAPPEDQIEIAQQILGHSEKANSKVATLNIGDLDASTLAEMLTTMFGEAKSGAPVIKSLTDRNALVVRGNDEQIEEVKDALKVITGEGDGTINTMRMRTITLDGGSAVLLAEELARVLRRFPQESRGSESDLPRRHPVQAERGQGGQRGSQAARPQEARSGIAPGRPWQRGFAGSFLVHRGRKRSG